MLLEYLSYIFIPSTSLSILDEFTLKKIRLLTSKLIK